MICQYLSKIFSQKEMLQNTMTIKSQGYFATTSPPAADHFHNMLLSRHGLFYPFTR